MKIIHIMKDGTVRDSVEGIVIPNGEFYRVLQGITEKRKKVQHETRKEANQGTAEADHQGKAEAGRLDGRERYHREVGPGTQTL